MLAKHPDQYNDDELEAWVRHLVDDKVSEGPRLDYKATISLDSNDDRKEAAKDISSFANEIGGTLLYGIPEDRQSDETAIPLKPYGVNEIKDLESRLENIYVDSISPRLVEWRIRKVHLTEYPNKVVYVVWTPESWVGSHMVSGYKDKRYYHRGQLRAVPMEEYEVRLRYERSQRLKSAVFEFLDSQQALFSSYYQHLSQHPYISNYILCPQLAEPERVQLSSGFMRLWLQDNPYPTPVGSYGWSPCAEGVESYGPRKALKERLTYGETTIYKNGAITRWGEPDTNERNQKLCLFLFGRYGELARIWNFLEFGANFFQQVTYYGPLWCRVSIFKQPGAPSLWLPWGSFEDERPMLRSKGEAPIPPILQSKCEAPIQLDFQLASTQLLDSDKRKLATKEIADGMYRPFGIWEASPLNHSDWNEIFA